MIQHLLTYTAVLCLLFSCTSNQQTGQQQTNYFNFSKFVVNQIESVKKEQNIWQKRATINGKIDQVNIQAKEVVDILEGYKSYNIDKATYINEYKVDTVGSRVGEQLCAKLIYTATDSSNVVQRMQVFKALESDEVLQVDLRIHEQNLLTEKDINLTILTHQKLSIEAVKKSKISKNTQYKFDITRQAS